MFRRYPILLALVVTAPSFSQEPSTVWQLREDLRIGSADGGPYALSTVRAVVTRPETGEVFVSQPWHVSVFDAQGRFVRQIGRRGPGPGEFERLDRLMWIDDTLVTFDGAKGQVDYFSSEGRHLQSVRIQSEPLIDQHRRALPIALLRSGSFVGSPTFPAMLASGGAVARIPVVQMDREGSVERILDHLDMSGGAVMISPVSGTGHIMAQRPIAANSIVVFEPHGSGMVFVHSEISTTGDRHWFRVRKIDAAGEVTYARNIFYTPRIFAESDQRQLVNEYLQRWNARGDARFEASSIREGFALPAYQPPISGALAGIDGSVWLRREQFGTRDVEWWILDSGGTPVGKVQVPPDTRILHADRDVAWGVEFDGLQVPYVVRYLLER